MERFRLSRGDGRTEMVFDDGGLNLLSSAALRELQSSIRTLRVYNDASMLVFRSGRPHVFAAGADMAEMAGFSGWDAWKFSRLGQEVFSAIEALPALTVALVDGDCFGGALDLILAFDLRIATPRSRFAHPGARLGIVTGFGGTSRWRGLLARPAANALFLRNSVLSAEEAMGLGLVDRISEIPDREIEPLQHLERSEVRIAIELARHAHALSATQQLRMSRLLSRIYSDA
ncbi:MAG TPA: enoyl-CoA hydratase/isomerase family protein [Thermoanaerobaculia bacterium]